MERTQPPGGEQIAQDCGQQARSSTNVVGHGSASPHGAGLRDHVPKNGTCAEFHLGNDEEAYKFLGEIKMTTSNPSQSMRSSCRSHSYEDRADMKLQGSCSPPSQSKGVTDRLTVNSFLNNAIVMPISSVTQAFDSSNNASTIISNRQGQR